MKLKDYLRAEVQTRPNESLFRIVGKILLIPSFNAVYILRRAQLTKVPLLRYYYLRKLAHKYGIHVGRHTRIGPGLVIGHPSSIIIGDGVVIGKNCKIYQQTTIGIKDVEYKQYPTIGDDVIIYAGAKIIGPIEIGNNSVIGANAVVTKSCPDNSVLKGVPAQCSAKNYCS